MATLSTSFPRDVSETSSFPTTVPATSDWKYEMRRTAQEIVPNLFVGPYQSSNNLESMQNLGLTHVLCIQDAREAHLVKARFPHLFIYKVLEIRDATDQNLIRIFPEARHFIDVALAGGGRVLVHCGDGISRSPAIVTAYVMCTYNMTHEDAFQYVQGRRFCIAPNQGFQRQIEAYQHIHEAARQCAADPGLNQRQDAVRRKRLDADDDEEELLLRAQQIVHQPVDQDMYASDAAVHGHINGDVRPISALPSRSKSRRLSPEDVMTYGFRDVVMT